MTVQKHGKFHQTVQFTDVRRCSQSISMTSNLQFNATRVITLLLGMSMDTAHNGFVITKSAPAQNLNYQIRTCTRCEFQFFKKTHPLWILTITKPAMVPNIFFAGSHI